MASRREPPAAGDPVRAGPDRAAIRPWVIPDVSPEKAPLLRQREFRRFWLARIAGVAANQMLMVALGWQMYELTGSAWDLGLVGLVQFIPALAFALPAGHVIDRSDRRRVLALAQAVQLGVAVALAFASHSGALGRDGLLAMSALIGAARAFQMPATQALLPQLVALQRLPAALALSSSALQAAIIAGPAVGGLLYTFGAAVVYLACAVGFAAATAWIAWLHPRPVDRHGEPVSLASMLAGLSYIRRSRVMLGAISLDLFAVLLGGAVALLPIFARDILHTGPWGLGLLRSAPAVGALAMSIVLARWPVQRHAGRCLLVAVATYGVTMLVFGLSTAFWISLAALAASGAADMVSVVIRQSLVQLETPDAMRGRVSAVNSIFIGASNQLGEFESGATAAWWGPVGSVLVGGAGTLVVVGLWAVAFPDLARRDRLVPVPASTDAKRPPRT